MIRGMIASIRAADAWFNSWYRIMWEALIGALVCGTLAAIVFAHGAYAASAFLGYCTGICLFYALASLTSWRAGEQG